MAHFETIRGSISPSLSDALQYGDGSPIDLTDATVELRLQHVSTHEVVTFEMTVDDAATGQISRNWQAGDLDIRTGRWLGQYVVIRGAAVEILPSPVDTAACDVWGRSGLEFHICGAIPAA